MSNSADELRSEPLYPPDETTSGLARREFLQAAGGLAILCLVPVGAQQGGRGQAADPARAELSSWLHIDPQGVITVFTGKVEVGQGIRTTLAQVVAEELRVPYTAVALVMGDTARVPYDAGTFGSRTTPDMAPILRRAGAAARELLLDLAAAALPCERSALRVAAGAVVAADGRRLSFGQLTAGQKLVRTITEAPTTPVAEWQSLGRPAANINGRAIVTGQHLYPGDLVRPRMLHGKVVRPPAYGAQLNGVDTTRAAAMPGVVVLHDGDFLGVAAADEQLAEQAAAAVEATWSTSPQPSERDLMTLLRPQPIARLAQPETTAVAAGLAAAEVRLEASYTVAYIAHVPLEPRAAVAEWSDGALTVWTGTQRPFGVRQELARVFGLPESQVRVVMPDTGSGYGGKHTGEAAVEAARLARAAGRPVKVLWSRQEEFTWAYFRPAGVMDIISGARRDGTLTAWEQHTYNAGPAGLSMPYEVPHSKTEFHNVRGPLRQGSYRGLAGPANCFARESHLDELARAVGQDPLAFRLHNLRNERLRAVFLAAAERFGWGRRAPGTGIGVAGGIEKGGYVATCVEAAVERGRIKVVRAVTAFECGALHNPDAVRNQIEGMHSMGLGGALFEAIHFADGKILNPSLSRYRVPRFSDQTPLEVVLLDRRDLPSAGAGETPLMALAPAIANALHDATGQRLRALPLTLPAPT